MRVFKTKSFARFARKARIADTSLCAAIADAAHGLIDADLGGYVLKQRVARQGAGKSGGFRTIILFRLHDRAFFVHGFAKTEQDNIRDDELAAFKNASRRGDGLRQPGHRQGDNKRNSDGGGVQWLSSIAAQ